jgi:hypothetical protein
MGKTHTSILRHFGYHQEEIDEGLACSTKHETEGIRYFQHDRGYGVALRANGAWRHCAKNGTRIGEGEGRIHEGRGHGPGSLEKHLTNFHSDKP